MTSTIDFSKFYECRIKTSGPQTEWVVVDQEGFAALCVRAVKEAKGSFREPPIVEMSPACAAYHRLVLHTARLLGNGRLETAERNEAWEATARRLNTRSAHER